MKNPEHEMQRLLRSTTGGTLPEYATLCAFVIVGSLIAITSFGKDVRSYFDVSASLMEDPANGGEGGTSFVLGPPPERDTEVFIPYGYGDGRNFLYGTIYPDSLTLDGTYDGVAGSSGGDIMHGTNGGEIFVGGLGSDMATGGGGPDTYVFSPGDGVDWIDETNGDSSKDTLDVRGFSADDVTARRNGGDEELVLSFPGGDRLHLTGYFGSFEFDPQFEETIFSDRTLTTTQEFRDFVSDKQKSSGSVYGTRRNENYRHSVAADGSYAIYDDHYLADVDRGRLTFEDVSRADVTFANAFSTESDDLVITAADGDQVRIIDQLRIRQEWGVSEIAFLGDGLDVLDTTDIYTKSFEDMKAQGGRVEATRYAERLAHDMATDGSYTLENNHYLGDPLEDFHILNAGVDDVAFEFVGGSSSDFRMTFVDGDVVFIERGFNDPSSSNDEGIADIIFEGDPTTAADDLHLDLAAVTAKAIADMKPSGYVRGAQGSETLVYTTSDPASFTYYPGYGSDSYVDTLDLSAFNDTDATFRPDGNDLYVELPGGRSIFIEKHFLYNQSVERMIFNGGSLILDEAAINARAGR